MVRALKENQGSRDPRHVEHAGRSQHDQMIARLYFAIENTVGPRQAPVNDALVFVVKLDLAELVGRPARQGLAQLPLIAGKNVRGEAACRFYRRPGA